MKKLTLGNNIKEQKIQAALEKIEQITREIERPKNVIKELVKEE
jgi:hypothetical protein